MSTGDGLVSGSAVHGERKAGVWMFEWKVRWRVGSKRDGAFKCHRKEDMASPSGHVLGAVEK